MSLFEKTSINKEIKIINDNIINVDEKIKQKHSTENKQFDEYFKDEEKKQIAENEQKKQEAIDRFRKRQVILKTLLPLNL